MPNGEKTTVEQLQSEVSDLEKLLNELKTKTFSDAEREKKEKDAKSKAEKLQGQIDALSKQEGIDPKLAEEKEKAKVLLESYEKTLGLKSSIKEKPSEGSKTDKKETTDTTQTQTQTEEQNPGETAEEKGFFGKAGDWIGEQWSDVRSGDKRKEQPGKNILRTVGFGVTGYAIYKGVKKLWNRAFGKKKKDEESESESSSESSSKKDTKEEEKSFWDKPVGKFIKGVGAVLGVGTGVYYVAHGLYTQNRGLGDLWDWERGKKSTLTVKESLSVAAGEVNCGRIDENMYRQNFEGIDYDENTGTISSYGESTKINEKNKCIVGLERVKFKSNTELVHAANIVNCLKYNLRGKGGAKDAFAETGVGGDIQFCFSKEGASEVISGSNTDFWENFLATLGVTAGTIAGIKTGSISVGIGGAIGLGAAGKLGGAAIDDNSSLGKCCSTIKDGDNFKLFIDYLNNIKEGGESIWLPGNPELPPDNKSPLQKYANDVENEIRETKVTEISKGKDRDLKVDQDPQNSNRYKIKSYGNETYIKINGNIVNDGEGKINPSSIQSITIEPYTSKDIGGELNLNFPNTEEGLKECIRVVNLTNMIRKEYGGRGGEKYPIFYNQKSNFQGNAHTLLPNSKYGSGLWIDTNGDDNTSDIGTRIMTNEMLSSKYPTLLNDLKKSESNRQGYFEDQLNGKRNGSSYLKYLNGMRTYASQHFWINGQDV